MTLLYRIEIEMEVADYGTSDIESSRYIYTNRLAAKAGAAEFVGEVMADEFNELDVKLPLADDFDWSEDDQGAVGSLMGWTFEVKIHAMEIKA